MTYTNSNNSETVLSSLDLVARELEEITRWAEETKNRNGYFAALYKNITLRVKFAIQNNEFEDGPRMDKFVQIFAGYYITAWKEYAAGKLPAESPWYYVFETGKRKLGIIQHMLLGVNVHINYDLANTCYAIAPGEEMIWLSKDFFKINLILSSAVVQVEKEIFYLSPIISMLARLIPKLERKLLNFSLSTARSSSWECACQQAATKEEGERQKIKQASSKMAEELSKKVVSPGIVGSVVMFFVSLFEFRGMKRNMKVLKSR